MFERYVAIGDSTTEGLDDPDGHGGYRGWADRLAEHVARTSPRLAYANLAVRGRVTRQIREEQLAKAMELRPDLASVVAGTNDLLRPNFELESFAADLEALFGGLRGVGAMVVTFTMPDLSSVMPVARLVRGRLARMNQCVATLAGRHGVRLVDFAQYAVAADVRLWSDDRLHASSLGHERVAAALADVLELPGASRDWQHPLPAAPPPTIKARLDAELAWGRNHFVPWLVRHARGQSSGDGRQPKRPQLSPVRR